MLCCGSEPSDEFFCKVVLLDDTTLPYRNNINFKITSQALDVFNEVCEHIDLVEKDYFGLRYRNKNNETHWIDLYKSFKEQSDFINHAQKPYCFYFCVKFYVSDPSRLKEEITRYQFFLQMKKDILEGKLPCSFKKATELGALALQSELGDYEREKRTPGYSSEFRLIPNQNEEFENEIESLHKRSRKMVPAEAEYRYLKQCKHLEMYGLDMYDVMDPIGSEYIFGMSARGIEMFRNQRKVRSYLWIQIKSIDFKNTQIRLCVNSKNTELSFTYNTSSRAYCKSLWKSAIEHHAFFRLPQNNVNTSTNISLTSNRFRFSGRTESEIFQSQTDRDEPIVVRTSSKRYPSRSSRSDVTFNTQNTESPKNNKAIESNGTPRQAMSEIINNSNGAAPQGMFSSKGKLSAAYVTPKSERRERNRQLHSLSDTENRHRRHRRGKSSGDDSDSPSKRRIRARNRQNGSGSENERSRRRKNRSNYYTDTEMMGKAGNWSDVNQNTHYNHRKHTNTDGAGTDIMFPDSRSAQSKQRRIRRKNNRLSQEDVMAQKQLWQHISKEPKEATEYTEQELMNIPYTNIQTEGNPLPIKLRKHSRGNQQSSRRTSRNSNTMGNNSTVQYDDNMVSPLSVTTTVQRDHVTIGKDGSSSHHRRKYKDGGWDRKYARNSHERHTRNKDNDSALSKRSTKNHSRTYSSNNGDKSVNLNHSLASTQV